MSYLDTYACYYYRGMQYFMRPQTKWNITIPRVVINMIFKFNICLIVCLHTNHVRALRSEMMLSCATNKKKITALVQTWLAPACIPERQHYILASKGWLVMTMSDLLCVCEQLFETS